MAVLHGTVNVSRIPAYLAARQVMGLLQMGTHPLEGDNLSG
jgi:hypothetical protein